MPPTDASDGRSAERPEERVSIRSGRFAVLQRVTLEMISSLHLGTVLSSITDGLSEELGAKLARIWLLGEGDLCSECHKAADCSNRRQCLHLKSTSGLSRELDGRYRRVPIGAFKIGRIAETRQPTFSRDVLSDPRIQDQQWARDNDLRSFAGYPLVFRDELLGVLGIFTQRELSDRDFDELAIFANEAAIAIKNAQLFSENASLTERLAAENTYLQEEIRSERGFGEIVGRSEALSGALKQLWQVAPTDATVLLHGETGTGKELMARALHRRSNRHSRPLIKVNCAAISAGLVESELFGHEKGAFTGALQRRVGRFELADGGTILLDEVGELPLETQVKLLRVLQEGEIDRVGSSDTIRVDVRVVAASNRDLGRSVAEGTFRPDLFYRLNVFPIRVPPLRERLEDLPLLVEHFLDSFSRKLGKPLRAVTPESMQWMKRYEWPGNVRELANLLERAAILARGDTVVLANDRGGSSQQPAAGSVQRLEEVDRRHILHVLESSGWRVEGPRGAARLLGLRPSTLRSRMRKLGISRPSS